MKTTRRTLRERLVAWWALVLLISGLPGIGHAASPLGGQQTGERLDRRKGDRQLQTRLDAPRLHWEMRADEDMIQTQARPSIRAREWDEERAPRPQPTEDPAVRRRRRIGATLD